MKSSIYMAIFITIVIFFTAVGYRYDQMALYKDPLRKKIIFNGRKILNIISYSCFVLLVSCVFVFYSWDSNNKAINKELDDVIEKAVLPTEEKTAEVEPGPTSVEVKSDEYFDFLKLDYLNIDFNYLKSKNEDTVAWLEVKNTQINYPVVQSSDNDYYLTHSFSKKKNNGGWVFADFRGNFNDFGSNTIIYGHNRLNDSLFGTLNVTQSNNWLKNKENHYLRMATPTKDIVWQVFSVYTVPEENYYIKTDFIMGEFKSFIETMASRSKYNFGVAVTENDKILTLSTCGSSNKYRTILQAKLLTIKDKTTN